MSCNMGVETPVNSDLMDTGGTHNYMLFGDASDRPFVFLILVPTHC